EDRDAHPGDQLAGGRNILFDLMVQRADLDGKKINVQAADIGPRIVGVKRPEDDVIAVHTPDFPSWKGNEGRVRDAVEEGVVREGRRQHARVAYSLLLNRDELTVVEGLGLRDSHKPDREQREQEGGRPEANPIATPQQGGA